MRLLPDNSNTAPTFDYVSFRTISHEDLVKTQELKERVLSQLAAIADVIADELDDEDTRFVNSEVPR